MRSLCMQAEPLLHNGMYHGMLRVLKPTAAAFVFAH
jgi:hypothetical protein